MLHHVLPPGSQLLWHMLYYCHHPHPGPNYPSVECSTDQLWTKPFLCNHLHPGWGHFLHWWLPHHPQLPSNCTVFKKRFVINKTFSLMFHFFLRSQWLMGLWLHLWTGSVGGSSLPSPMASLRGHQCAVRFSKFNPWVVASKKFLMGNFNSLCWVVQRLPTQ